MKATIQWFRDEGRGQEAADFFGTVEQTFDGEWPVASLPVPTNVSWIELLGFLRAAFSVRAHIVFSY